MADLVTELKSKLNAKISVLLYEIHPIIQRRGPAIKSADGKPFAPYSNEEVHGILQTIVDLLKESSTDQDMVLVLAFVLRECINEKKRNSDELSSSSIEKSDRVEFTKYLSSLRKLMLQIVYFFNIRIITMNKIHQFNQEIAEKIDPKPNEIQKIFIQLLKMMNELKPSTSAFDDKKDIDDGSFRYYMFEFVRDIYYDIFDENVPVVSTSDIEEMENKLKELEGKELKLDDFENVEEKKTKKAHRVREQKTNLQTNMAVLLIEIKSIIGRRGPATKNVDGKPFEPYTNEEVYGILHSIVDDLQTTSTKDEIAIVAALVNPESTKEKSQNSDKLLSSTIEKSDRVEFTKYLTSIRQLMRQILYILNVRIIIQNKTTRLNQNDAKKVKPRLKENTRKILEQVEILHEFHRSQSSTSAIDVKKDFNDGSALYLKYDFLTDIYYEIFDEKASVASTSDVEKIENQLREHGKKRNRNSDPDFEIVEKKMKNCKLTVPASKL
ncbi:uncharacterized protein LOC130674820 [Microplitis mediator]|uniref:uncharacterized protein LOC130674820 n=1 Tax=Microplitis mediator TaxID=375433 RepID=UPI00255528B8|nr:uncharacterized protein LOC130674820 [Microplitis mediator]